LIWFDLIWFDLIWFDLIWFALIWFDLIWFWFALVLVDLIWLAPQNQIKSFDTLVPLVPVKLCQQHARRTSKVRRRWKMRRPVENLDTAKCLLYQPECGQRRLYSGRLRHGSGLLSLWWWGPNWAPSPVLDLAIYSEALTNPRNWPICWHTHQ
jgi:hypothetical protein